MTAPRRTPAATASPPAEPEAAAGDGAGNAATATATAAGRRVAAPTTHVGTDERRPWRHTLARAVSIAFHPFATALLTVVALARGQAASWPQALGAAAAVALAVVVPLAALMAWQVARGAWRDVDASLASQRPLVFAVALAGHAALLGALALAGGRPAFLWRGTLVMAAFLAVAALLTRRVKLSLHAAFAMLAAVALGSAGSPWTPVLVAAVPAVAWSRLALGRHRPREVALGLMLGAAVGAALGAGLH